MFEATMTEAELEAVLDKAATLSTFFREIGPKYDVENTFAYPSIEAFKKSGLGAVPVPKEYGGLGGDLLATSKVVSELSKGDSAITLAYNMHYIMVGIAGNLMSDTQNTYWLGRVADGDIMFGPFSEQRAGFSGLADMKAIPQPGGGWKLYGKKTWGTLCEAADIITTNATITDADGNLPTDFQERVNAESFFIGDFTVDENGRGDGIRIEKTWNALGMHATGTQVIHFEGYYVPEDGFICEWRSGAFVAEDTKVASVGHIIDGVGDMASRVELSRRVLYQTCQDVIDGKDDEWPLELRFPYIGLAKTFISENVMHMSRHAMSLVGGSSFRKGTIFERLYRDSAASMFQPLNADQSRTYIGEYLLAPDELAD
jgi:alkylation response protein AidB-like acyl-CoA dehydrogenase